MNDSQCLVFNSHINYKIFSIILLLFVNRCVKDLVFMLYYVEYLAFALTIVLDIPHNIYRKFVATYTGLTGPYNTFRIC